jgi:putative tryptophan/tyrosine transport system substrate-binding protein
MRIETRSLKQHSALVAQRSVLCVALCVMLFALCSVGETQSAKIPHIGFLLDVPASTLTARIEAFQQGLRELGYVEGKNIVIEWREASGNFDRARELADELVHLKVDVLVSPGPSVTRVLREATSTIPIVMAQDTDPVGSGFALSLARPGRNITGLASLAPETGGKQMELLREISPKITRVAIIGNSNNPGDAQALRETVIAAGSIDVFLRYLDVPDIKDLERIFQTAAKARADALLVLGNPILNAHRKQIVDLAAKHRFPATYGRPEFVEAGGLLYYGTNYNDLSRRAATFVDKILKGAKPADLPIEQPTKFEFIINLKAAKQIGLAITNKVLAKADRVIR